MSYDLDQNTAESFQFILGGHTYTMRYPTTEEIVEAQKLPDDEARTKKVYEFVSAPEGAPSIEDALSKATLPKLKAFNEMITKEWGAN